MNLLKFRYLVSIAFNYVRGGVFRLLYLPPGNGKLLRLGRNLIVRGTIEIGNKSVIGSNVKISHNCSIGSYCLVDNNVELRSSKKLKISIGNNTSINRNTVIIGEVYIGSNVSIAPSCVIVGSNHSFDDLTVPIKKQGHSNKGLKIQDDVWIGANVSVLDGVTVGKGSIIGAGSVVTKSIPEKSIAYGNPCRVRETRG